MCGRYVFYTDNDLEDINAIIAQIQKETAVTSMKTGEIFPTEIAPVLVGKEGRMQPTLMKWGLPQYQKSGVIINARAETVADKPTFGKALRTRRCVIPSTGFFEWTHGSAPKEKYLFVDGDRPMLYMAGIYTEYPNELARYVILTTQANASMADIHNRMPVILRKTELEDWISENRAYPAFLLREPPELRRQRV